ncbi:MAG: cytochrome-c peroxidase, partial [Gammaproteobacteria bacterium]|nr:cytochrome-c peroxidase [Gammaproteobacteria bacterium]
GSRNSPTASYSAYIPPFRFNRNNQGFSGGLFVDGRADTLEEQAKIPFTNPLEMNNPDLNSVVDKVSQTSYATSFTAIFGVNAFADPQTAFNQIAEAIAAYERSTALSPFNSKFDAVAAGLDTFSQAEQRGRNLFFGRAGCSRCHRGSPP